MIYACARTYDVDQVLRQAQRTLLLLWVSLIINSMITKNFWCCDLYTELGQWTCASLFDRVLGNKKPNLYVHSDRRRSKRGLCFRSVACSWLAFFSLLKYLKILSMKIVLSALLEMQIAQVFQDLLHAQKQRRSGENQGHWLKKDCACRHVHLWWLTLHRSRVQSCVQTVINEALNSISHTWPISNIYLTTVSV